MQGRGVSQEKEEDDGGLEWAEAAGKRS
jgi:hypothetical protein